MAQRVTSARFVGRQTELTEVESALAGDRDDLVPALYFVAGESGVGKTRLLRELIARTEGGGGRAIGGACVELGEDELPYAPLVAALRPLQRAGDPVLDQLSAGTRAELARLNPEIGDPSTEPYAERGEAQRRLFDAFLELVSRLGEERPVLLWIEDIHWADRSTRSFLRFLAASLNDERVVFLATYRSDELHRRHPLRPLLAELERSPNAHRLELDRFDRAELTDQLADILGASPSEDVIELLYERSDGNPLFTEELIAAGDDGRGGLPPSLREALLLRVERLSDLSQSTLRLLAVAGRADDRLLAEAGAAGSSELSAALREAVDAQIVVALDSGRFAFRHALLREVLYDDLLPGERAELHLALAGAMERIEADSGSAWAATGVAHHYHSAGDQPRALTTAIEASTAVRQLHAYGEAAALLDRAIELWPRVPDAEGLTGVDESELLARAARAHYMSGEDALGVALYERAIEAMPDDGDSERLAELLHSLAGCQWSLGRAELSRTTQQRGLDLLEEMADSPTRARLLAQKLRFLLLQGRFGEVTEAAPEALEAVERLGLVSERAGVLNRLGYALLLLGEEDEARARIQESIEIAESTGSSDDLATAYLNFADALHLRGQSIEAREMAERGIAKVEERLSAGGSTRSMGWIHLNLAEVHFDLGDWDRAVEEIRAADATGQGMGLAHVKLRSAQIALAHDRVDEARADLERADELLRDALEPSYIAMLAELRARLGVRTGDLDGAARAVDAGLDRIQFCSEDAARIAVTSAVGVSVHAERAVLACDLGDEATRDEATERARSLLELVRATAEDSDGPIEAAELTMAEADYARALGDDDPALWRAAAQAWDDLERPYPGALSRWREAQAALEQGDRKAATIALAEAERTAKSLGATWLEGEVNGLAARARVNLNGPEPATPADADAPDAPAPFGLTARELQVLELVAEGATNREIGERLFMAEKTASVHVSRILTKLDVRGRTEAAAVAHRHGIGVET